MMGAPEPERRSSRSSSAVRERRVEGRAAPARRERMPEEGGGVTDTVGDREPRRPDEGGGGGGWRAELLELEGERGRFDRAEAEDDEATDEE